MTTPLVQCGNCGTPIDESLDPSPTERRPCPACGGKTRTFNVSLTEKLELHDSLRFKHKRATGKLAAEGFSGDDLHLKSGKWMKKERLIDHEKDEYKEIVTDPESGEEVHRCEEPLSKHTGHGTPPKKKP